MISYIYNIGDIGIKVNFLYPFFMLLNPCGSKLFETTSKKSDWEVNINYTSSIDTSKLKVVFKGPQKFEEEIPYKWQLLSYSSNKFIHFEFENNTDIKSGLAIIDEKAHVINLKIATSHSGTIHLDPFFHPIGILILQYITHLNKGIIMHASAINYNNCGFLFSAVSGTGKSTMAKLWQQKGATIINDDRIVINPSNEGYQLYNTPMPYYIDENKKVKLKKLFIIRQSPENYIKPLKTTNGILSILSNCIQYQFDENQITERLDYIADIVEQHGVFELGFKPDTDIVDLIINQFG